MDKILRNNAVLRIVALVLACILWLTVNAPNTTANSPTDQSGVVQQLPFPFPVHVEVDPTMVVTSISSPTVNVMVKSTMWNAMSLPAEMMKVQLIANAQGLGPGKYTLPIAAINVPNVDKTINPPTITVVLETKTTVTKPVKIQLDGTPASGKNIGSIMLDDSTVQISGAKTNVNRVAQVVGTVSIAGASSTFTKVITLNPVDQSGQRVTGVDLSPTTVSVTVPVQSVSNTVNLVPQITGQPADGFAVSSVRLSSTEATVFGVSKNMLPMNGIMVPVNVSGLEQSQTVHVQIPGLPGMTGIDPKAITATVVVEPSVTRIFTDVPIQVQNAPANVNVTISPPATVTVHVSGPESIIQSLTANDIKVYIDASRLKSGAASAPLNVQVPEWIDVTQLSSNQVSVQVSQTP